MMFKGNSFLKLLSIYFLTLLLLVIIMFFSMLIPHKMVEKHANESIVYGHKQVFESRTGKITAEYKVSDNGDLRYAEMVYLVDNNKPVKSLVEMNSNISGYYKDLSKGNYTYHEYSRYWHGPVLYLRVLMIFMNIKNIYNMNKVLIVLLLMFFIYYLFKKDKVLSISFLIISIAFSLFYVANNISYFNMVVISIIGSIIAMELYRKRKDKFDILFIILGLLTAFFDFYTIDTLTLTLPLLFLIIINRKDNKEIELKTIIKYVLLWFIAYLLTIVIKWVIDYFYIGSSVIKDVFHRANVESYNSKEGLRLFKVLDENFKLIIPFYYLNHYLYLLIPIMIAFIYNMIYHVKNYRGIYIIIAICFIRLIGVSVQSISLTFTTFRVLIPFMLFLVYVLIKQGVNIIENKKSTH